VVTIIHHQGNSEKLDFILQAAQKRLGRYGFEKTTMSEIAADVNMSKASLYYYFPDKESLLRAVLYKELEEYFSLIGNRMKELDDPEAMIREFIRMRHEFFTTFLNLAKFRFSNFYQIRPHFQELIAELHSKESELLKEIFSKGILEGRFVIEDLEGTGLIFLEIIHSLRLLVIRNRNIQDLTQEDFDQMYEKHRHFLDLFIRGIRKE
jgi:AcrR family transcriptional regulator